MVVRMRWLLVGMLGLVLAGCNLPVETPTPSPAPPSSTPTLATPTRSPSPSFTPYTPIIMCTPPLCWNDETYFCPKTCPGGCGTTCATRTPDPKASPTPTFPPIANPCWLPTANAGTPGPQLAGLRQRIPGAGGRNLSLYRRGLPRPGGRFSFHAARHGRKELAQLPGQPRKPRARIWKLDQYPDPRRLPRGRGKLTLLLKAKAAGSAEINVIAVGLPGAALYSEHHAITVLP